MEKARAIMEQLGGARFAIMTGAKNFMGHDDGVSFKLPSNPHFVRDGINYVRVRINGMDLYNVEYGKIRGCKYAMKCLSLDLYADMLQKDFTQTTGLDTRF